MRIDDCLVLTIFHTFFINFQQRLCLSYLTLVNFYKYSHLFWSFHESHASPWAQPGLPQGPSGDPNASPNTPEKVPLSLWYFRSYLFGVFLAPRVSTTLTVILSVVPFRSESVPGTGIKSTTPHSRQSGLAEWAERLNKWINKLYLKQNVSKY